MESRAIFLNQRRKSIEDGYFSPATFQCFRISRLNGQMRNGSEREQRGFRLKGARGGQDPAVARRTSLARRAFRATAATVYQRGTG